MKTLSTLLLALLCCTYCYAQLADQRMGVIINNGDYIELSRQYPLVKDSLSPVLKAISEACIDVASNKPAQSVEKINYLLKNHVGQLGEGVFGFLGMLTDQLCEIGEYAAAADILQDLIKQVDQPGFPKEILGPLQASYRKCNGLRHTPKSEIVRLATVSEVKIDTQVNGAKNHLYVPVDFQGAHETFIFDTGASRHLLSESFAKKHKVKVVADSVLLSGFGTAYTQIGVVDSLRVGDILYRHVVFNIAKDEDIMPKQVSDSLNYKIDAVLGVEFMKLVGHVDIFPQENLIQFREPSSEPSAEPNMMFANGLPYVEAFMNNTRLLMSYDTGAKNEGTVVHRFYKDHPADFAGMELSKESVTRGSFAGMKVVDIYRIPHFPLRIGNKEIALKNFVVEDTETHYDGTLGLGYFKRCNQITLDFCHMTFAVQ